MDDDEVSSPSRKKFMDNNSGLDKMFERYIDEQMAWEDYWIEKEGQRMVNMWIMTDKTKKKGEEVKNEYQFKAKKELDEEMQQVVDQMKVKVMSRDNNEGINPLIEVMNMLDLQYAH